MRRSVIFLLSALIAGLAWSADTGAQEGVEIRASDAQSEFPDGIVFTLEAAGAGIGEIRLIHELAPDGVRATTVAECSGGTVVSCTVALEADRRNLLIPGAEVTFFWRITVDGVTQETASQRVTYDDDRFDWQQISDGNLTLWSYRGSEDERRRVLAAGRESLDTISDLLQTEVDFPVKIFYYASREDMGPAIITDDREDVVTLGEVVYSDTAMVSAEAAPEEIARHEIAHIVVRQALQGPYGVPDWLNEGTAVFAQTQPLADQRQAVERAIESGRVLSLRSLSSAASGTIAGGVSLFYGQSWSLVAFLVERYGEEQFAQLFQAFREGAGTAEALEQVYGFDQDGLEDAWRESVGLPPRQVPTPDEEQVPSADVTATPEAEMAPGPSDDDGVSGALIVAVAALAVLLAGGLVGAGLLVARRYR